MFHRTIKSSISCCGYGVFCGKKINVRLCPAECGKGIYFVRDDVKNNNIIKVNSDAKFVVANLNNTISNGINEVIMIEHLLSALWCFKITDLEIHVDAQELPMFDGSANFLVKIIKSAGIVDYPEIKQKKRIVEELEYKDNDVSIYVKPNDCLKITYEIDYDVRTIGRDKFTFDEKKDDYISELSLARTFCTEQQVETHKRLKKKFNNNDIIIFNDDGFIINDNKLRYKNEPTRHKILDLIGDLMTTGEFICGEFICRKSGHSSNRNIINLMLDKMVSFEE